jgi:hypothetical protein
MQFDLDQRSIALSVGAFADFFIGPRDSMDGPQGLWRAQLGTRWHKDLRAQLEKLDATALFEVPISGSFFHRGWTIKLTGRIDQITTVGTVTTLREVKTVLCALPSPESELRAEHPSYFVQAAVYLSVYRSLQAEHSPVAAMLVFV